MAANEFYDQELLDRFRPRLRYDRQYDYRTTAVETMVENPGNLLRRRDGDVVARVSGEPALTLELLCGEYPGGLQRERDDCLCQAPDHPGDMRRMEADPRLGERVYGRCVREDGRTWLQFWLWIYYNPKNLLGFGKHEGDWEMVQLGLGADGEPEVATYAQHDHGEARDAGEVAFDRSDGGAHPVVFVAPFSHASYFESGTHPYLLGIDHPYGDGPWSLPPVEPFGEWVHWPGRWGSTEHVILGKIGNGPPSPSQQEPKWSTPGAWHARLARRRPRVHLGRVVHALGARTFPPTPRLEAVRVGSCVHVRFELGGSGPRTARHLLLTVHEGERVLESRAVRSPGPEGEETLILPDVPHDTPLTVMGSAFNRLRQRSDVTTTPVQAEAPAGQAAPAAA